MLHAGGGWVVLSSTVRKVRPVQAYAVDAGSAATRDNCSSLRGQELQVSTLGAPPGGAVFAVQLPPGAFAALLDFNASPILCVYALGDPFE